MSEWNRTTSALRSGVRSGKDLNWNKEILQKINHQMSSKHMQLLLVLFLLIRLMIKTLFLNQTIVFYIFLNRKT